MNDEDKTLFGESAASFDYVVMNVYASIVNDDATDYLPRKMLSALCGIYIPFMPEVLTSSQATISAQMTAPVQIVRVF